MKGTQYKIRCSEVLRDALKVAGAEVVRGVLEEKFLSEEQRMGLHVDVPPAIVEAVRRFGPQKAMEMMFPVKTASYVVSDGVVVPPLPEGVSGGFSVSNEDVIGGLPPEPEDTPSAPSVAKHPLEDEKTESGAPSWPGPYGEEDVPGSATVPQPPPRASYVPPRAKEFYRTPEQRAEKLKALADLGLIGPAKMDGDDLDAGLESNS